MPTSSTPACSRATFTKPPMYDRGSQASSASPLAGEPSWTKSSSVVSLGRNVTVSWTKFRTAMRISNPSGRDRTGRYYRGPRQGARPFDRTSTARPSRNGGVVMARIPIAPPGMKDQRPRYTLGWRVGNTIYVAGQLPYDKDGNLVGKGDIKAQTRRIFEQIKMIVEAGGGKMDDVVKVTVFVIDVRYREAYGEVRSEFFGPNPPASTLVQISNLAIPEALIEIEAV